MDFAGRFLSWWMDAMGYTYTDPAPEPDPERIVVGDEERGFVHLAPTGPALDGAEIPEPVSYPYAPPNGTRKVYDQELPEPDSLEADRIMAAWVPIPDEDEPIP